MKKIICLTLAIIILFIYGGSTLVWAAVDISVDIYRHPYNGIYGDNIYTSSNPDTSSSSNSSTGSNSNSGSLSNASTNTGGSGTVDIISKVKSPSLDEIYGSTVSMTIQDSNGNIYSNYDYVNGFVSTNDSTYNRSDIRTITLPGNDVYKLNTVVTSSSGESSSITKEFDIRAVSSIPENIRVNFSLTNNGFINATWTPLANVDKYVIFMGPNSGFSEYYYYYYPTKGYDNCSFIAPHNFSNVGKWELYLVAFSGDLRIGRSQEFTFCNNKELIASFKDKNLENAVRTALNKPYGDILKSDVEKITVLDAINQNIFDLDGIQQLTNLGRLDLDYNHISDLKPLNTLTKLNYLSMEYNSVSNIEALQFCTKLEYLNLRNNIIQNISPLKGLQNLTSLLLYGNNINNYTYVAQYYYDRLVFKDFPMNRDLFINGVKLDADYTYEDGLNVLFPLRLCAESMGLNVSYDAITNEIIFEDGRDVLKLFIGKDDYVFDGLPGKTEAPVIVNGRTLVPIALIAQSFKRVIAVSFNDGSLRIQIQEKIKCLEDINHDGAVNIADAW